MLDNKWNHGAVHFQLPPLPDVFRASPGIKLVPLVLDPDVGGEIVLLIIEPGERICEFENSKSLDFFMRSGLVNTSYGPVYWLLFYFTSPPDGQIIAYENSINPKDENQTNRYKQLASQKYWHVIMADNIGNVVNFFEFENSYGLDSALAQVAEVCADMQVSNFMAAKAEYEMMYTIDELLKHQCCR